MGKELEHDIVLPRQDKDGNYYISYSQYNLFTDKSSFNLSILGVHEYIQSYFMGRQFPDQGWGEFGTDVEDYICYSRYSKKELAKVDKERAKNGEKPLDEVFAAFDDREKAVLDKIEPLGEFQREIKVWIFPNVYIKGYIDDTIKSLMVLRDYKTASKRSGKKYEKPEYKQLDIYALYARQETGKLPEKLEVCIIERKGNCFNMENRRDLLKVGGGHWFVPRETSHERLDAIMEELRETVLKISSLYKTYLKLNKKLVA